MPCLVQKYGGTSVGTPERIQRVARRIAQTHAAGTDLVVVVSAMGDTTDDLIELAHRVSPAPPQREMDMLLSAGERISMALLSMALSDLGVPALSFTGSQSGIVTTEHHRRARIRRILGDRVRNALQERRVAIVAGFQGVSETKEITTLGRGGSDTTAVAIAAALGAPVCEIYTDVDGVFSADPRLVPHAHFWPALPMDLMVEMAARGAGVLHPRSVELGRQFEVAIRVRNSLSDSISRSEGTLVTAELGMEDFRVTGITMDREKFFVELLLVSPRATREVLQALALKRVAIGGTCFGRERLSFFMDRESETELRHLLQGLERQGLIGQIEFRLDLLPLSVVGSCFTQDTQAFSQVIETLDAAGILATMGTASPLAVTVAVSAEDAARGVRALHDRLIPT